MKKVKYVLDTSAILSGKDISSEDDLFSTPLVIEEIKFGRMKRRLDYLIEAGLKVHSPTSENITSVTDAAKETGDMQRISKTDIEVLSLAQELDAIILTDDYSIQNLAKKLGIRYSGISQKGIEKVINWKFRCKGCGRYWEKMHKGCPVCGSELKTARERRK
jgi:UPF0271 protein